MARLPKGIEIIPKVSREAGRVLSSEALHFVAELQRGAKTAFEQLKLHRTPKAGLPDYNAHTTAIRTGTWKAATLPRDLVDLRCGIVTPTSRKELLSALNSGAKLCLADFADFTSPSFDTLVDGHSNLMDRWTSAMEHVDKATGKRMSLSQRLAALMVQPRSAMTPEPRVICDGKPVAAGLFDAGLYLFHNASVALAKASGPYLQLTGIASQTEARLWNDVLLHAQSLLELPAGSIRVHLRIDRLQAAFEIDEIVHELREHAAGLTPGGESYCYDVIRNLADRKPQATDGGESLAGLVIRAAHRRGLLALAPMARTAPRALAEKAVRSGFDGLWTAHPDHVTAALKVFNDDMPTANQIYVSRDDAAISQKDMLKSTVTAVSEDHVRQNIAAALAALESWLSGGGPVAIDETIADRASADLQRAELWHWLKHGVKLESGAKFSAALFEELLAECLSAAKLRDGRFKEAANLLRALVTAKELAPDIFALAWKKLA